MERAEAEAIYDAGRERCVEVLLDLSDRQRVFEERLSRLERERGLPSRNSSIPPSQDRQGTRQERRALAREKAKELLAKDRERREAGGQTGHPGVGRELLPEEEMSEIVDHYPTECHGCGHEFADGEKVPRAGAGRHQVAELPPITVFYTEHRTQRLRCPECRKRTRAALGWSASRRSDRTCKQRS